MLPRKKVEVTLFKTMWSITDGGCVAALQCHMQRLYAIVGVRFSRRLQNVMTLRIALIGECMVELSRQGDALVQGMGGDTLNTAVYLSRMLPDADIAYLTGLGLDPFSEELLARWNAEGINTQYVHRSATKLPGLYSISTDPNGERHFHYWRNDSAAKFWLNETDTEALKASLAGFYLVYLSGISLAILPREARQTLFSLLSVIKPHCRVVFDNNFRPALWDSFEEAQAAYREVLALTDIAMLTFDDEQALWGDETVEASLLRTQSLGVSEVVYKHGAKPCEVFTHQKRTEVSAEKVVQVVDTTAAGDSFSAGYLAKRLTGGGVEAAAQAGHKLAGQVIQHHGAIIPLSAMPTI
ncbi:2-dehydro-3-deoxygluconokinase [Grimontia celer]|uniref:2-dehydro-3-deoxygluconokinase n=2 Tax=Grimontia celer TaxID=1796497 RepID=A0A128F014_9GAMM|nr:2-dehydro-3-deoxygluconokinase [Grimontia celer]